MELAHTVRTERSADWGLSLCLDPQAPNHQIQIALVGAATEETRLLGYAGPPASLALWASTSALNLLRQTLLHLGQ
jgi:hypothetical protein